MGPSLARSANHDHLRGPGHSGTALAGITRSVPDSLSPARSSADGWGVRLIGTAVAVFLAGLLTSLALAVRPPGVGHGHDASGSTTQTTTVTVTTTTAGIPPKLLVLCHHTSSAKHPYVTVRVPANAVWTRVKHGDLLPEPSGSCPSSASAQASPGKGHKPSH